MIRLTAALLGALLLCQAAAAQGVQGFSALARLIPEGSEVRDAGDGVEIGLNLSQGVPYRIFTLTEPDRLVIDFAEVDWGSTPAQDLLNAGRVAELRIGGFRPGWSRLVARLAEPLELAQAQMSMTPEGGARLEVRLAPTDRAAFDAAAGAPHDPRWDLPPPGETAPPEAEGEGPLTIVLDPGHGGIDPGAQNGGVDEADLMLRLAREVKEALLRAGGLRVVLTREADEFVSLERRVALAHEAGADLFISLHADALEEGIARGATVYTLAEKASDKASAALAERHDRDDLLAGVDLTGTDDEVAGVLMDLARLDNAPRSRALARHVLEGIRTAVGTVNSRPLRHAGFSVLKAADIPSILVEVGFLSTERDLKNLQDPVWRAMLAAGIRDGVQAWMIEDAATAPLRRR